MFLEAGMDGRLQQALEAHRQGSQNEVTTGDHMRAGVGAEAVRNKAEEEAATEAVRDVQQRQRQLLAEEEAATEAARAVQQRQRQLLAEEAEEEALTGAARTVQ